MSTQLHLIRHCPHGDVGHVLTGRSDGSPLTEVGLAKARRLGAALAREGRVVAVHSSPRLRALQTSQAIAEAAGLEVETAQDLDEIDFGEWTGRSFVELDADPAWTIWNTARATARPPCGEAMGEAVARAVDHIEVLACRDWEGTLACVTHCDIIRGVVAHYLGLGFDNLLRFDVDPGSVSTLVIGPQAGRLITLNRECA